MSWERDPLFAKARLFFEWAFEFPREDPQFGLWCAFGLELLARAALASISPTLLAEPNNEHKHLLHSLGRGAERSSGKSIGSAKVFALCKTLFDTFRDEEQRTCTALLNRRNDELHTGGAPFDEYPTSVWLAGFYRACNALATALGETLETVLGNDEAEIASKTLASDQNDTKQRIASAIGAHKKVFDAKNPAEQAALQKTAAEQGEKLAHLRHHRAICPSCKSTGLLQGEAFGNEHVSHGDGEIVVKQSVAPTSFACSPCGLKLNGFSELVAAGLSGHYTRTTTFSPEEYYGLVDLDNLDIGELAMKWLSEQGPEYDNE
jgi:hypothetical protein